MHLPLLCRWLELSTTSHVKHDCMYMYMYIYVYTCIYVYIYTYCTHIIYKYFVCVLTLMCMCMYIYEDILNAFTTLVSMAGIQHNKLRKACLYVCMYVYIYIYIYTPSSMLVVCIHIQTVKLTHIHT